MCFSRSFLQVKSCTNHFITASKHIYWNIKCYPNKLWYQYDKQITKTTQLFRVWYYMAKLWPHCHLLVSASHLRFLKYIGNTYFPNKPFADTGQEIMLIPVCTFHILDSLVLSDTRNSLMQTRLQVQYIWHTSINICATQIKIKPEADGCFMQTV